MNVSFDEVNNTISEIQQSIQELSKENISNTTIREIVNNLQNNQLELDQENSKDHFNKKTIHLINNMKEDAIKAEGVLLQVQGNKAFTEGGIKTLTLWRQLAILINALNKLDEQIDLLALKKLEIGKKVERKGPADQT